mmetsp:Transcript_27230/g.83928  ORF Transcript_27230/g.83928 Transcript_27230/m.83928 type:complete len:99 (+) Transcript_27230:1255-1551(+)
MRAPVLLAALAAPYLASSLRVVTPRRCVAACAPSTRTPSSRVVRRADEDDNRQPPPQPEYDVEGIDFRQLDPTTLTLVGFGLIAFNFFVLAGFGSGGL